MKVALIGATGKVGSKLLKELIGRGHKVTAISRHPATTPPGDGVTAVSGDAGNPKELAQTLKGHDAIISAAPFVAGSSAPLLQAILLSSVKRYIAVGGAGSLEVAPGVMLKDSGEIPEAWMPAVNEGAQLLKLLRAEQGLEWTFFSPAAFIGPGERTGKFRLGGDQLIRDETGKSAISYDDYAIALVDELERPKHIRARFTIGY